MSFFVVVLIIIGLLLLSFVLFSGWVFVVALKAIVRTVGWLVGAPRAVSRRLPGVNRCPHARCRADNAAAAHFCRRCGTSLAIRQVQSYYRANPQF